MPSDTTTTNLHRSDGGALKGGLSRPLALLTKTWLIVCTPPFIPIISEIVCWWLAQILVWANITLAAASLRRLIGPSLARDSHWTTDVSEAENVCCLELSVSCGKLFADQDS